MKAILLAAGFGTRLRPLTDDLPKCLVPILGKPLLEYWLELLDRHGVTEVLINTHYLPERVEQYVAEYTGKLGIHLFYEPELLGSAGTIHACRDFVAGEDQFLILYADNLTNVDLTDLIRFNSDHPAALTVGLFHAENPSASGIAVLNEEHVIVEFIEKPAEPKSDLASAGVFVGRQDLFGYIAPSVKPFDFGAHVMPLLQGKMNGTLLKGYLRDIGTHESLARAEREYTIIANQ